MLEDMYIFFKGFLVSFKSCKHFYVFFVGFQSKCPSVMNVFIYVLQVLEAASKCYECLCSEEFAIAGKCDVARKTLIDSLIAKFKESMHDFFAEVLMIIIIAHNKFEIEFTELSISDIIKGKDIYICACLFQCSPSFHLLLNLCCIW